MRVIKRYANRKLYDTRSKRYVTLRDLAELVRRGDEVRVIDHVSDEDITDLTLAQIIFEQEKSERSGLPQVTLRALIQASNQALAQLRSALPWSDASRAPTDAEIKRRFAVLVEWGDVTEAEAARLSELLSEAGRRPPEAPELDAETLEQELRGRGVPTRAEVQALAQRLEALAAELDELEGRGSAAEG